MNKKGMIEKIRLRISNLIFYWLKRIGVVFGHACGIMFLSGVIILTSIASYFLFYHFYLPPSQISSSLEMSPILGNNPIYQTQLELFNNTSLKNKYSSKRVLKGKQKYNIYLDLKIYDTPGTFQRDSFSVVSKITSNQKDLLTISKPIKLEPRLKISKLIRFIIFQIPLQIHLKLPYVPNFLKDSRKISVECFENYEEENEKVSLRATFPLWRVFSCCVIFHSLVKKNFHTEEIGQ
ncbi:seipin [Anaeramoeba flamelloides]|uniref:Seipin n=1 Tax=Anaeramoeba flamelloides TaxID=1746091 RepID=A0ABQ8YIG9_9EUKA|nr:seipin [Anaeramoeba flamelloides]